MTPSVSSVPEGTLVGTPESGYLWTCSMCNGLRLVEEVGKLTDCPKCETAHRFGVAFELVRRNITPVVPASERLTSPAVETTRFVYEVWEFFIEEGAARRVMVEDNVGPAYIAKWDLEEATYGPVEERMGP
jgi:hypothetical protein